MKDYVYRIVSKYKKDEQLLATIGFNPYTAGETGLGKVEVYAVRVNLDPNSSFVCDLKKMVEKAYNSKDLDDKDREEFKDKIVDGKVADQGISDLTNTLLCFYANDGELFLNIDGMEYHSTTDIAKACPLLVSSLLDMGAIYKKKVSYEKKPIR